MTDQIQEDPSIPAVDDEQLDVDAEVVNLSEIRVNHVQAELARIHNSMVLDIAASEIEARESLIGSLQAQSAVLHDSGALLSSGETLTANQSYLGAARTQEAVVNNSKLGVLGCVSVEMTQSHTQLILAREVKGESIRTNLLLAGKVEGAVETLADTRQVLLGGLVAGAATGLVLFALGLLKRRKC